MQACDKYFAVPLWANIQEGLTLLAGSDEKRHLPKTVQIVEMARRTAWAMKKETYLILDAYFSVGPVFLAAAGELNGVSHFVHILTRAKKNVVAYGKPPKKDPHKRGPAKKYGKKIKLMDLFDSTAQCYRFQIIEADIYGQKETVRYFVLDLLWKPVDAADKKLKIDTRKSSLGEGEKKIEAGPFELSADEPLKLQVFVDKSVVEVFANDRQAVMRRIYPTRADSVGVKLFSKGGSAKVKKLQAWDMMASNAN